jgi:hypothetical protein
MYACSLRQKLDASAALRSESLSDVRELRRLLDGYMRQLAILPPLSCCCRRRRPPPSLDRRVVPDSILRFQHVLVPPPPCTPAARSRGV